MSNFAVTTLREHWSKKSEKLSPFLPVVRTKHRNLAFCILRVLLSQLICFGIPTFRSSTQNKYDRLM